MRFLNWAIDPGGISLRDRLGRLSQSLEELASRLREGVARVISQTVAEIVRDSVCALWARLLTSHDLSRPAPWPQSPPDEWNSDEDETEEPGWQEERMGTFLAEDQEELAPILPEDAGLHDRELSGPIWSDALGVGCQVVAWWLRRQAVRRSLLATVGVGIASAAGTYFCGPLTTAGASLARSALTLLKLAGTTRSAISALALRS